MMRHRCVTAAVVLGGVLLANAAGAQERRFLPATITLERTIGESATTELMLPQSLTATADGTIVLFDAGDAAVRAFSAAGTPLWRYGRKGRGPGEFSGAEDVFADRGNDILVLDNENRRVTRLRADGTLEQLIMLPDQAVARRLLPTLGGADVTYVPMGGILWESAHGATRVGRAPLPSSIRYPANIVAEQHTAGYAGGAVIAYRWSSTLLFIDTIGFVARIRDGIEPIPFPQAQTTGVRIPEVGDANVTRVASGATEAARAVSVRANRVYVLFAGSTADAGRIIDVYDVVRGTYIGSYRLPSAQHGLAVLPDGRIATLEHEPVPVVRIWRIAGAR